MSDRSTISDPAIPDPAGPDPVSPTAVPSTAVSPTGVTTAAPPAAAQPTSPPSPRRLSWRVVDIVVAAVLGAATGLILVAWNTIGAAGGDVLAALTPGLGGLAAGGWMIGGVLGGLIVRKPGAAIFVEVVAALVSAAIGSQWGLLSLLSGLAQGLGAELIFLILLYRRWSLLPALAAGAGCALLEYPVELIFYYGATVPLFKIVYLITMLVSGAVIAGGGGWLITRALARTGALNRFEAGRETRRRV
ncbi:MAG: ECF transporter S component [Propionibacteriaceae bacterium]|nr:ECF transporter S component [Propionibacteriaceae bacterium]